MDLIKAVWEIQYCQISGYFCPRYILSDLHYKWEQFQEDLHHFPIAAKQFFFWNVMKIHVKYDAKNDEKCDDE